MSKMPYPNSQPITYVNSPAIVFTKIEIFINGQKYTINKECIKYQYVELHQGSTILTNQNNLVWKFTALVIDPIHQQKMKVILGIQSPYIVLSYNKINTPDNKNHFLIIDRVDRTLSSINMGALAKPIKICRIMIQILKGLQTLHMNGIYHLNLCPDTVAIVNEDVKLYEFNLHVENLRTRAPKSDGYYKAPEQVNCQTVSDKTDVWAAGAILYYLISGKRHLFQSGEQATQFQFNLLPNIIHQFYDLLSKMLQQQPQNRGLVQQLIDEFERLQKNLNSDQQLTSAHIEAPRSQPQQQHLNNHLHHPNQLQNQEKATQHQEVHTPLPTKLFNNSNHQNQFNNQHQAPIQHPLVYNQVYTPHQQVQPIAQGNYQPLLKQSLQIVDQPHSQNPQKLNQVNQLSFPPPPIPPHQPQQLSQGIQQPPQQQPIRLNLGNQQPPNKNLQLLTRCVSGPLPQQFK